MSHGKYIRDCTKNYIAAIQHHRRFIIGLPKIHKLETPLRPITRSITPYQNILFPFCLLFGETASPSKTTQILHKRSSLIPSPVTKSWFLLTLIFIHFYSRGSSQRETPKRSRFSGTHKYVHQHRKGNAKKRNESKLFCETTIIPLPSSITVKLIVVETPHRSPFSIASWYYPKSRATFSRKFTRLLSLIALGPLSLNHAY